MRSRFLFCLMALVFSLSVWTALFSQSVQNDHWRKLSLTSEYDDLALNQEEVPVPETRKPLFLLHVGPSKTATTSIQWFAASHEDLLHRNNIYFLGHFKNATSPSELNLHLLSELCYSCKKKSNDYKSCRDTCSSRWNELEQSVMHHYSQGHNLLISNELFSGFREEKFEIEPLWNQLVRIVDQSKWDVRIVFSYRRYFEWVPSKYYQLFNPKARNKNQAWVDDGGRSPPLFSEYYESHKRDLFKHPLVLRRKWKKYFPTVWVFNMHEPSNSLVCSFFCKMLPEATHACSYLKRLHTRTNATTIEINSSSKKVVHFDMLANEAYRKGWIRKNNFHSRTTVWRAAQEFGKQQGLTQLSDFPKKCLTNEQTNDLLNQTLKMEKEMVPEFFKSPLGERALTETFGQAKRQGKFCSIHANKVLKQEEWKRFFQEHFAVDKKQASDLKG